MDTHLYISCFTSDLEVMRLKWALKKTGGTLNPQQQARFDNQTGSILTYSWDDDAIINEVVQGCPFGMCIFEDKLFVCDAKSNTIVVYNARTLEQLTVIRSKMFNDVHSVVRQGEYLIITSTGVDSVVRVSLRDYSVEAVVTFSIDSTSKELIAQKGWTKDTEHDYSRDHINTEAQVTHLNYAAVLDDGRLGISLFHQGKIVGFDEKSGRVDTLVEGLFRSHAFFSHGSNFFVADSGNHCVKIFDRSSFKLKSVLMQKGWVQDIKHITINGRELLSVADADNGTIEMYDLATMERIRTIHVNEKYRLSSCELVPAS